MPFGGGTVHAGGAAGAGGGGGATGVATGANIGGDGATADGATADGATADGAVALPVAPVVAPATVVRAPPATCCSATIAAPSATTDFGFSCTDGRTPSLRQIVSARGSP